ncbi:hypothetical protein Bca4012_029593 [Brassica carinata]
MVGTEETKENELGIEKLEDACENDSVGEQRTAISFFTCHPPPLSLSISRSHHTKTFDLEKVKRDLEMETTFYSPERSLASKKEELFSEKIQKRTAIAGITWLAQRKLEPRTRRRSSMHTLKPKCSSMKVIT